MKKTLTYILSATLLTALVTICVLLSLRAGSARSVVTCNAIDIRMKDSLGFVSKTDIRNFIDNEFHTLIGQRIDSLPLHLIEDRIMSRGAVKACDAWVDRQGTLHLDVSQRYPVLRFDGNDCGFYIDERGFIFPLHKSYTADVTVVEGNVPVHVGSRYIGEAPTERERQWIASMLDLHRFITHSRQWRGQIRKIRIAPNGDTLLTFGDNPEIINIGAADNLEDKFHKISVYFSRIKPFRSDYKKVNVKYNNQIICRKDI